MKSLTRIFWAGVFISVFAIVGFAIFALSDSAWLGAAVGCFFFSKFSNFVLPEDKANMNLSQNIILVVKFFVGIFLVGSVVALPIIWFIGTVTALKSGLCVSVILHLLILLRSIDIEKKNSDLNDGAQKLYYNYNKQMVSNALDKMSKEEKEAYIDSLSPDTREFLKKHFGDKLND